MEAKVQKKIKRKLTQKELDNPRNSGKQLRTINPKKTIDDAVILVCGECRLVKKQIKCCANDKLKNHRNKIKNKLIN